jgi:hypothetical protein
MGACVCVCACLWVYVRGGDLVCADGVAGAVQEIGLAHLRIAEGVQSQLQLMGLLARLCRVVLPPTPAK